MLQPRILNNAVALTEATNGTFYYYIPVQMYNTTGIQFDWTPGATGTVTVTIEGCAYDGITVSDLTYRDITNAVFGVASWVDSFIAIDSAQRLSALSHIRVKVVTLATGADTAWTLNVKQAAN